MDFINQCETSSNTMCNLTNQESVKLNVKITDLLLTPLTCAVLINEIIKCLIYQKSQIPYPYNWLKSVISRKQGRNSDNERKVHMSVDRNYHVALTAHDTIEEIMKNIQIEFGKGGIIEEILIIFGATPYCPKEVFLIKIPRLAIGHNDSNHASQKIQQQILRSILSSDGWLRAMDHTFSLTNMYVILKKQCDVDVNKDSFFLPIKEYSLPNKVRSLVINLYYDENGSFSFCDNVPVYLDSPRNVNYLEVSEEESYEVNEIQKHWFQAKLLLKGYKDCFVNKVSVSELF